MMEIRLINDKWLIMAGDEIIGGPYDTESEAVYSAEFIMRGYLGN